MKIHKKHRVGFILAVMVLLVGQRGLGQVAPDLTISQTQGVNESDYFFLGPTGMSGWMYWYNLTSVARQILVTNVRTNTPAHVAGMQYRDVILGTNNVAFHYDARKAFIEAVTDAEGTDGELDLWVYRPSLGTTNSVMIQLGITNAPLASTTPFNCDKALAILTNYCEYVYTNGPTGTPTEDFSIWAMLGSGIPKYESWATNYIQTQYSAYSRTNLNVYTPDYGLRGWHLGFQLITLSQYYLYTVDQGIPDYAVLPALTNAALYRAQGQSYQGFVSHTFAYPENNGGMVNGSLPSYGPVSLSTLGGLYGMVLARNCGVNHPEVDAAIDKSAAFFRGNVGLGTIGYGFSMPYPSVTDANGRNALAAFIFRALGEVENAKWYAMMSATYGWRDWGHTGNEYNHAWGPLSAIIGGPDLVNFIHTNGVIDYYQVSLNMRRQPEGWFQSQGQAGRGGGRSGGHATGSYALQMVTNRTLEITGAGYSNDYWLTEAELDEVKFAYRYESSGADLSVLDKPTLMTGLSNFCPKVGQKMADELNARMATDPTIRTDLITIITDANAEDGARVNALRGLKDDEGLTNATVMATVNSWYAPTNSYTLMWGAVLNSHKDKSAELAILEAVSQLDRGSTMDMAMVGEFGRSIYQVDTNGWSQAEMDIYFSAVDIMLSPDAMGSWFLSSQGIKDWPASVLAGYADFLLRVSERAGLSYTAPEILATKPFGEGLYTWMMRSSEYTPHGPYLDTALYWFNYGQKAFVYTNQIRALMASQPNVHYTTWSREDAAIQISLPAKGDPDLIWFVDEIASKIDVDYPGASITDLRGLMTAPGNLERPLYRAVVLEKLVTAIGDTNAFADIVQYVGSKAPIAGTDWRLYRAAIELGTNATYSTDTHWTSALADAIASNDTSRITGIFHVLAERGVDARISAEPYLLHENDFVIIGALDVYRATGTEDDLLMLYNQFMTNCYSLSEGAVVFDTPYKIYAYNDAIHGIVERDGAIAAPTANALAAAFNTVTSNGTVMTGLPDDFTPRAEPMSILHPTSSQPDKVHGVYSVSPIALLGLFPGTDCDTALRNVYNNIADDRWAGRGGNYAAGEAFLRQHTIDQILAFNASADWSKWNSRHAANYLLREILLGNVSDLSQQRAILQNTTEGGQNLQRSSSVFYARKYQYELSRRRGLDEEDAVLFFYVK